MANYSLMKEERVGVVRINFLLVASCIFWVKLGPRHFVKTIKVHATTITEREIWYYGRLLERFLQRVLTMSKVLFAKGFS